MKIFPIKNLTVSERDLLSGIYNKNFPLSVWSKKYFLYFLLDLERSSFGFYAKEKDAIIGFVLGRLVQDDADIFCLNTLWVDENFRGHGLGEKLVQKIIGIVSKKIAIKKIILHFRDANDLKDYYSRLGFSNHVVVGKYSNGNLKHHMELVLNK